MAIDKVNFFTGLQGVNPAQQQQAVQAIRAVQGGANPFAQQPKENGVGVGLVNSSLSNMSYRLPNGEMSNCNTRFIA